MKPLSPFRIDAHGPFDHEAVLDTLAAHAVDGLIRLDRAKAELTRWIEVRGQAQLVSLRLDEGGVTLAPATNDGSASDDESVRHEIVARVRHWFDLDTDLGPINDHLAADPLFAEDIRSRPGIRITRFPAPFEAVILTVLGQQVTLAAGRLFAARLVAAYGSDPVPNPSTHTIPAPNPSAHTLPAPNPSAHTLPAPHPSAQHHPAPNHPGPSHPAQGLRRFPTPQTLAAVPVDRLRAAIGLTRTRARTLHEIAVLFATKGDGESLPTRPELHAVQGIGPWTLDHLAIRAGTDTDAFPSTDAVLRRALTGEHAGADRIASWSPYRSYAATRLWALVRRVTPANPGAPGHSGIA